MVDKKHVKGERKGEVMLYALSTCGWCKKTRRLLNELGVEYHYVDVDLVKKDQQENVLDEVRGWNPRGTFPTLVINDECIVGYKEEKIKEVLGA
jgi:glutaredoxin-like protein NrdH